MTNPDGPVKGKGERYKLRAREISRLAQDTPFVEVREQLLQLAMEYELLGEYAGRVASSDVDADARPIL